jgi:hypothetical protein
MFPKFTEFVANEQPKSRLEEAERNRLAKAFQPQKIALNIKSSLVIKVINFLLNLI